MSSHAAALTQLGAVSHTHILQMEILSVISAMRKNSRWASHKNLMNNRDRRDLALASDLGLRITSPASSRPHMRGSKEAELMAGFLDLKRGLRDLPDLSTVPLPTVLAPFFALIRSPLSTGPITSVALSSLHAFFVTGLISSNSPAIDTALIELSSTVSQCKFESSDSSGDEVVLLRIMTVIHDCMCSTSVGTMLGDMEVCEMLETVLTTCCQMRLSEILRRSAESTMHALVRVVFSRLHALDPVAEEDKIKTNDEDSQEGDLKMTVTTQPEKGLVVQGAGGEASGEMSPAIRDQELPASPAPSEIVAAPVVSPVVLSATPRPEYGLPSILELLRVLINVLDPSDQQHTDSTRLIALGILNTAFEASGGRISAFPSLEALVLDSGCKFLFQLVRSDNTAVLQAALRTISTIMRTIKRHLKLQQELFIAFSIDRLAPPHQAHSLPGAPHMRKGLSDSPRPGTPAAEEQKQEVEKGPAPPPKLLVQPARGETRDLILEAISQISSYPSFMVDLYTNYDCNVNCENLFERVVDFLTEGVYPSYNTAGVEVPQRNVQYLCLDLLLALVNDMASRAAGNNETWPDHFTPPKELAQAKSQKKLVLTGAQRFNAKPKTGLAFLEENGLIYSDLSPEVNRAQSLAMFLKTCTRLDKRLLGDFLSRPDNLDILKAFIGLIDFKGKHVADALREMLESFRLPGESQQISRITETFASIYFASGPAEVRSEDAVYVLAYSVIMLNTDLHNPQIRASHKRMSIEDYTKNLRGVNDGQNFTPEYLQEIYDSIRKREIIMPEEHTGLLGFEYAWKELLARSRQAGDLMVCNTALFDVDMFKAVWKPLISAIAYAFISFDDDYIIQRSIAGFRQCATLAGQFDLPDVFDFVVVSLSQATSLLSESSHFSQVPNYPVLDVEGQTVTVSSLSVKFGTNFKGQLAAVVLFNIVNGNGNALREGWTQIFEMFQNLFLHSLLPTRMLQMEDFLGGVSMIPLRGKSPQRPAARSDGGLLSALSSYLMTPYGGSNEALVPDATDMDVENTLCTIDCIASCRLDELYGQIVQLEAEALMAAVRALEALAHERTVARLKQELDDAPVNSYDNEPRSLPYDPASVFLLEMIMSIACQTQDHIDDVWPVVFEHLSALLSTPTQYSVLLIERAVVSLLRLCLILAQKPSLRDQVYVSFDLLSGLPQTVKASVSEQIVAGVMLVVQKYKNIIQSQTEWNLVFALLRTTTQQPEAARLSFDLITSLIHTGPEQMVTPDNISGLILLLDEFATLAGMLVEHHTQQAPRSEPLTSANSPPLDRGRKAIDLLVELRKFVKPFMEASQLPPSQAWKQICLPLLASLGRQSLNHSREIRHASINQLQRVLLGPGITFSTTTDERTQSKEIFNRVIFPLLDQLLKPPPAKNTKRGGNNDAQGLSETRLRALALLCKSFMHLEVYKIQAAEQKEVEDLKMLWINILDILDRLMNVDRNDQLYEAVPESLKNVLLVMNAAGILVPSKEEDGEHAQDARWLRDFWTATHQRMERFVPGFLEEVIAVPPTPMKGKTPL